MKTISWTVVAFSRLRLARDQEAMIDVLDTVSVSAFRIPLSLRTRGIEIDVAKKEHEAFVALLRELELDVIEMPSDEELPESVFVEDTAVVCNNIALITKPGNPTRLKEVRAGSDSRVMEKRLATQSTHIVTSRPASRDSVLGEICINFEFVLTEHKLNCVRLAHCRCRCEHFSRFGLKTSANGRTKRRVNLIK